MATTANAWWLRFHGAMLASEGPADAWTTHQLLGRRLRKLTLWHVRELHMLGCPLLARRRDPGLPEEWFSFEWAWMISEVCRSRPGVRWRAPRRFSPLYDLRVRLARRRFLANVEFEALCLGGYLGEFYQDPLTSSDGKDSRLPWFWMLVCAMVTYGGMDLDRAWATTPGEAMWLLSGIGEMRVGKTGVMSEAEFDAGVDAGHLNAESGELKVMETVTR